MTHFFPFETVELKIFVKSNLPFATLLSHFYTLVYAKARKFSSIFLKVYMDLICCAKKKEDFDAA